MTSTLSRQLQLVDYESVERFSFKNLNTSARVCRIIDPDSVLLVFKYQGKMIKVNARLEGLDAPERHSKIEAEANACKIGTDALEQLIGDAVVNVEFGKFDKYGRVLVRIDTLEPIVDNITSVNDWLIQFQYARCYSGGLKVEWKESDLEAIGTKLSSEKLHYIF